MLPRPEASEQRINTMIRNLWMGRYSLPVTFWVFGFLGPWIVGLAFGTVGVVMVVWVGEIALLILYAVLGLAGIGYYVVWIKGCWRAATDYPGSAAWSVLAKTWVSFSVIANLAAIILTVVGESP